MSSTEKRPRRARFRDGLVTPTAGRCDGFTQANLGDSASPGGESRAPLAIAHTPGHMLITDARDEDYRCVDRVDARYRRRESATPTRQIAPPTSASTGGSSPSSTADITIAIGGTR